MNPRTLKILLAVTVVVVLLAVVVQRMSADRSAGESLPDRVTPALADRVNDVAEIEVSSAGGSIELERRDSGWVVASKAGYPAKFETVKEAIVSISQLEPAERKTADPARYDRLGLQDPSEDAESVRVMLRDAEGKDITGVVLGTDVSQGGASQRYVRTVSDSQAWLAEGKVNVPTDPMQWMERELMRIPRDEITRITITHPDGEVVSIAREEGGTNYTLASVPEGRTAKSASEVGATASALAYLRFDDVRSAENPGLELGEPTIAVYEAADGLRITAKTWEVEGVTWASFSAEAAPPPDGETPADATEPESDAETGADVSDTSDPGAPADAAQPAESSEDGEADGEPAESAAAERASELNAKLAGWLFAIPEYQAGSLRKRLEDLTQAPEPPAEEAPSPENDAPSVPLLDARDDPPEDPDGG